MFMLDLAGYDFYGRRRDSRVSTVTRGQAQGAVGDEDLAGGFFEQHLVRPEEAVDFGALFERDEEDLAAAVAPFLSEFLRREEDVRRVGKAAAEEHGGGAAV